MPIKLLAVDMDGTFLSSRKTYDRQRFLAQYRQLKDAGVKFVVASGNQRYQLESFFPEIYDEISYVAENGAYIVSEGQDVFVGELPRPAIGRVLETLTELPAGSAFVVCAKRSAYMHRSFPEHMFSQMQRHYHRLQWVEDYAHIDDTVFKFALSLPGQDTTHQASGHIRAFVHRLESRLDGLIAPVSSGFGAIDLIIPGLHKANGLRMLQEKWGIFDAEVVAFGDGGNDIEMISQAGYGYAMDNAIAPIKEVAKYRTESNDEAGVLNVIDLIIERRHPFN